MRRAFTLMELMVSIVLIVLIALFLFSAIAGMKRSNDTLLEHDKAQERRDKIFYLLYRDIVQARSVDIRSLSDKHYTVLQLQTSNTLYDIAMPYVTYFVHNDNKRLVRLEAAKRIALPIPYEDIHSVHADAIVEDVTDFTVYMREDANVSKEENATTHNSLLLYINSSKFALPMLLELSI